VRLIELANITPPWLNSQIHLHLVFIHNSRILPFVRMKLCRIRLIYFFLKLPFPTHRGDFPATKPVKEMNEFHCIIFAMNHPQAYLHFACPSPPRTLATLVVQIMHPTTRLGFDRMINHYLSSDKRPIWIIPWTPVSSRDAGTHNPDARNSDYWLLQLWCCG
jgi:hypothetical protein